MDPQNQPTQPEQPIQPSTPSSPEPTLQKNWYKYGFWIVATVTGIVVVILLISNLKSNQNLSEIIQDINISISPTRETNQPTQAPATTSEKLIYYSDTAVSGKKTIEISLPVPGNLKLIKTAATTSNPGDIITNCDLYSVTDQSGTVLLTLRPKCGGWGAKYSPWDNSVVVLTSGDFPQVRINSSNGVYQYVTADSTSKQVNDAFMLTTNATSGRFIVLDIFTAPANMIDAETLSNLDTMIKSMSAQEL